MLEGGEEIVRARVDLATAGPSHGGAQEAADVGEQRRVSVVERPEQLRRALDVGEQEGDDARGELLLRSQLGADEADGDDPVLLGGPQQPGTCLVPRFLVLEAHLAEAREGVADVRRVVNGQTAPAARVDVRERAVRELRTLLRAKRWHAGMIARTDGYPMPPRRGVRVA